MQTKRPQIVVVILLIAALAAAGYYAYTTYFVASAASGALTASGTVEATEISIAPETSGKVAEVLVDEGNPVKAGDMLFRLDDSLLQAQYNLANASLDTAKAAVTTVQAAVAAAQSQYDAVLTAALNEDKVNRTATWNKTKPTDFNQPSWYFNKAENKAAVQAALDVAQAELVKAQDNLKFVEQKSTSAEFLSAEVRLANARAAFQLDKELLDRANSATDGQDLKDEAQAIYDDAVSELADAQKAYDDAITTDGAKDVLQARAKLLIAQERADNAQDHLRAFETGVDSPKVTAAQKSLEQVQAQAAQAQAAVSQAEANIAVIQTQMAKLVVTAPADGIVLTRNVEPGEVVNPGSIVFTLARLADLTLTVYVPEDRYGEVSLGQSVSVSVDSFPGETFTATVTHISDQAEFTPRNVQTSAGRKTTVFAIQLSLADTAGKLKPGMPADVLFK
jgi:HlyD family secretion protein